MKLTSVGRSEVGRERVREGDEGPTYMSMTPTFHLLAKYYYWWGLTDIPPPFSTHDLIFIFFIFLLSKVGITDVEW